MTLRLAQVGLRGWGQTHLANAPRLQRAGLLRLVAVADRPGHLHDPARAQTWTESARTNDPGRLLSREAPDAVVIATPPHLHAGMAQQAFAAGAHVLVEKPPAVPLPDLDAMIAAGARTRRLGRVGFNHLGSAALPRLRRLLAEGELGDVVAIGVAGAWQRDDSYYRRAHDIEAMTQPACAWSSTVASPWCSRPRCALGGRSSPLSWSAGHAAARRCTTRSTGSASRCLGAGQPSEHAPACWPISSPSPPARKSGSCPVAATRDYLGVAEPALASAGRPAPIPAAFVRREAATGGDAATAIDGIEPLLRRCAAEGLLVSRPAHRGHVRAGPSRCGRRSRFPCDGRPRLKSAGSAASLATRLRWRLPQGAPLIDEERRLAHCPPGRDARPHPVHHVGRVRWLDVPSPMGRSRARASWLAASERARGQVRCWSITRPSPGTRSP